VGTPTHKLPHGVAVNEGACKMAAEIWQVPVENIDPKPTYHAVEMFRALDRGNICFMWVLGRWRSFGWSIPRGAITGNAMCLI
jgi:nitrate reductase NapA